MKLTFLGATREVTGTKHLLEVGKQKILFDAGMFQGHRQEAEEKNRDLPFDPQGIDAVVLSHAHLDHCGSLPTMYKQGFRGKIFATSATRDVAELIMYDSAHIQEMDNRYIAKVKGGESEEPLYTASDVEGVMNLFEIAEYHEPFAVTNKVTGVFRDAGHILGSSVVELTVKDGWKTKRLGFSGDLGRSHMPILRNPEYLENLDALIIESTYGNRVHEDLTEAKRIIKKYVSEGVARQAKMVVPSFALGRTQELVYILHQLIDEGELPRFPIYVDSPLAINITDVFVKHPECYDKETLAMLNQSDDPFGFRNLTYVQDTEESKKLNRRKGPFLVIAAAGMCEAGRIRHHLANSVEDPNNMIIITGFMARNTLGRKIVEREKRIKIFDHQYALRAQIVVINALSAHADVVDLTDFIDKAGATLKRVFLVHGEETQSEALRERLNTDYPGLEVAIPQFEQSFKL